MKQTNTPQDMAQANQPTLEIHKAIQPSEVRAGDVITFGSLSGFRNFVADENQDGPTEFKVTRDAWQEFEGGAWYVLLQNFSGSVRLDLDQVIVRR